MIIVFTTVSEMAEGEILAAKLVEAKLAACVQIMPQMNSFYIWEGKVQNDSEHLLLVKTLASKFGELCEFIRANHSYETPEIVAINSEDVESNYLKWINDYLD